MLIVADENIPYAREVFSSLGEVRTLPGREMTARAVRDAELLLVRSVTKVDAALLEGARVRFVATATIGTDHIDAEHLRSRGIALAAAPGSNARSVAEYVAAGLLVMERRAALSLEGSTIGIVGVGNVGSRVEKLASALGMRVLRNDPPRARLEGPQGFVSLDEIARAAEVVTFHVPLTREGDDPTYHMIDGGLLSRLREGAVLVNTSRGAVAETAALRRAARGGRLGGLVLDVWENEPAIDLELLALADLATPHIAGYSYDGKVAGTRMIYEAACRFLGVASAWPESVPPAARLVVEADGPRLLDAVGAAYDIEADDRRMREALGGLDEAPRARAFDRLRKEYPVRREFGKWRAVLSAGAAAVADRLRGLGFVVELEQGT